MSDTNDEEGGESEFSYTSSSDFGLSSSSDERQPNIQAEEDYFPPIVAIFYSIFHPTKGPTVIYQVPEGSIYSSSSSKEQSSPELETGSQSDINAQDASDVEEDLFKKRGQPPQAHAPLFDFRDLSEYIVPRAPLCGRLITYSTTSQEGQSYKVLSHPVLLVDQQKYPRNSFIFNLAFVFDGRADVRAYEPIVRKCARELKDLEQNSSFLSRSQFRMYELIEQLFEDLNSYYESFVALPEAPHSKYVTEAAKAAELLRDKRIFVPRAWNEQATQKDPITLATTAFAPGKREPPHGLGRTVRDALNVKLFPTYTNPKEVNDWDVPVTLLDLSRRISDNWDLTMRKVLPFVDGINHVKRISQLADADIELTRQCIEHLLYYRCIILIDTFQFTNMYTVRPTIAILAEDETIMNECAAYVTRRGYALPTWPKLLSLYSSLRPSVTLNEWIEENGIDSIGIDVRRFVTFGVIKGFLRRVHRYPVLLLGEAASQMDRLTGATANSHHQRKTRATVIDVANVAFDTAAKERQQERSTTSITPQNTTKRIPLRRGASSSTIRASSTSKNRKNTYDEDYRKGVGSNSQNEQPKIPQGMIEMLDGNFPDDAFCVCFNRSWNDILHLLVSIGLHSGFEQQPNTPGDLTPQSTLPRRGRQSSHQGSTIGGNEGGEQQQNAATGGAAPDESGFGQMSGFWGLGPSTTAGQSNKRAGTLNALGPATTVTAFPSLPRYRTGSQGGQSGFSRYTSGTGGTGGDSSVGGGWNSSGRAGNSGINLASFTGAPIDDISYEERKRILRGDLGRVQIIVK